MKKSLQYLTTCLAALQSSCLQQPARALLWSMLVLLLAAGCEKDNTYRNAKPTAAVPVSTYDFLKSQQGLYDTLLYLVDKAGLTDTLKSGNITFFAPQDYSIKTALYNLNFTRGKYSFPGNWTLDSVPTAVWDTLLRRYMMRGQVTSDSLQYADGVALTSMAYDYQMNGKSVPTAASGIAGGGPLVLQFSDMNRSRFTRDWSTSITQSIDLKTANGYLHVLESKHVFGFISLVPMAFPYSLNPIQSPYLGLPSPIPGTIEFEDYDDGGEGLAYHDNDAGNNGNQYRTEAVDIENCSEGSYNVGWTNGAEWLEYTVDVTEAGTYNIAIRIASGGGGGNFHFEFDGTDLSGSVHCPDTGGWQNWITVNATVTLKAGKQVMRFYEETGGFNVNKMTFIKI
ncbi:MAG TPA: carbohydrate-binding protein [Chitinophaga sp.]|uniref:carbohydrate-binding protein n=1 Tax=Chitinophaga sp. TaxID=1869181 RepID=UPI002DB9AC70|nr:carbohydrate-binding protein [Chitinophaga sp.]HEU4554762.1 carbohydrate-binding protein [Chitinophaga sp.]